MGKSGDNMGKYYQQTMGQSLWMKVHSWGNHRTTLLWEFPAMELMTP